MSPPDLLTHSPHEAALHHWDHPGPDGEVGVCQVHKESCARFKMTPSEPAVWPPKPLLPPPRGRGESSEDQHTGKLGAQHAVGLWLGRLTSLGL